MELDRQDGSFAVSGLPAILKDTMKNKEWYNKIFVAGGYIRSVVTDDKVNDIDIFVADNISATKLLAILRESHSVINTENAHTIRSNPTMQIIYRWFFNNIEDVVCSFDYTICCAGIYYNDGKWYSYCDDRFYIDLASKRLIYRNPIRNEDAGGSLLRVLKYYKKGFRITLNSYAKVIARAINSPNIIKNILTANTDINNEQLLSIEIEEVLKEVDPNIMEDYIK